MVSGGEWNAENAVDDVHFLVHDAEAIKHCENGWSVSCAYMPMVDMTPGKWHNVPYDGKVVGAEYAHLAIVEKPRYASAVILQNSNGGDVKIMDKIKVLFNSNGVQNSAEVSKDSTADIGGKKVTLGDMIAAHIAMNAVEAPPLADDHVVTLPDGKTATVKDLKASFEKAQNTAPAPAPAPVEKPACSCGGKPAVNAESDEEKKEREEKEKKEKEAKNAAFVALQTAANTRPEDKLPTKINAPAAVDLNLSSDKLKRGMAI